MNTEIGILGRQFTLNGQVTYPGATYRGRSLEGLLFNSRMVQAIFDDECAETRSLWAYPDTGVWDPDRNTDEFCAALADYRRHGLLAVTVGLQGGGSIYTPAVFGKFLNSAFRPDGSLKPAYLARLRRVLEAADRAGLVVIVNYFYGMQQRFDGDDAILTAARNATAWLLESGHGNILVDVKNEIREADGLLESRGIHRVLQAVREIERDGRRLLVSTSTFPTRHLPAGDWPAYCDFLMPHGNDSPPDAWRRELTAYLQDPRVAQPERPVLCNEDSIHIENLEIAAELGCSWGYYDQGYGSDGYHGKFDWRGRSREARFEDLSGFQTVPINWSINTDPKRRFFERLAEMVNASGPPA